MERIHCVDVSYISAAAVERWHLPTQTDTCRIAGIELNNQRIRAVMEGLIALSVRPTLITTPLLADMVRRILKCDVQTYTVRQAAYDLKKFRAKSIIISKTKRSYLVTPNGLRSMVAYLTLRDKVMLPVLRHLNSRKTRKPYVWHNDALHTCYQELKSNMWTLFHELHIAA
jgi:hypothetical protein